jgi:hypothetical protein
MWANDLRHGKTKAVSGPRHKSWPLAHVRTKFLAHGERFWLMFLIQPSAGRHGVLNRADGGSGKATRLACVVDKLKGISAR